LVRGRPTLDDAVSRLTDGVREDGPHRTLGPEEVARVPGLLAALLADGGGPLTGTPSASTGALLGAAAEFGMAAVDVAGWRVVSSDPRSERSWMLVAVRAGIVPDVLVQVPHPRADLDTELVGVAAVGRYRGAMLLQAGAHRRAGPHGGHRGHDPADVAHRTDSLFALVADGIVARTEIAQLQLHGFADRIDALDVVVSSGAATEGPLLTAVAAAVEAGGERVGLGSDPACADLAGGRNVQGRSAARHGTEFVHLEMSRSLRRDPQRRDGVAAAISGALQRWRSADLQ